VTEIRMPRLSDSMEEGTIIRWLKQDGERLAVDEELLEVETDKATVTVSSEWAGLLSIVAGEGATIATGELIARVTDAAEELDVAPEVAGEDTDPAPAQVAAPDVAVAPVQAAAHEAVQTAPSAAAAAPNGGRPATPLARRAARVHGVDLAQLPGTGPRGRITRADVLAAAGAEAPPRPETAPAPTVAVAVAEPPASNGSFEAVQLTRLQRLIARRMTESRATIPEFEVQTEVAMDAAVELRESLRPAVSGDQPVPSLNDLIVKACAVALRRHPRLNASYAHDHLRIWNSVNIGIAVATAGALIVPTVRDADTLSLGALARETRRLSARVRNNEITPAELEGGTFTVSNLGMFGMIAIRPVINPPQVAILGVGAVRDTLGRDGGEIVDRKLMTLTLSADHRAVYGADAAAFLDEVRQLLQAPLRILV
jgi:pyruvate dehydrogenase E2 component (dihydrolipoamide acetyltransferase)